jgi:hypothetical protein
MVVVCAGAAAGTLFEWLGFRLDRFKIGGRCC